MRNAEIIESTQEYLALLTDPPHSAEQRVTNLAEVLDRLALAYHTAPDGVPMDSAEPPRSDHGRLRELVQRVFPDFGNYVWAAPNADPATAVTIGDAIDDLADIAVDLEETVWRWQQIGPDDAAWHFRFGFRSHWGRHLQNIRSYVHAALFESPRH